MDIFPVGKNAEKDFAGFYSMHLVKFILSENVYKSLDPNLH